MPCGSAGPRRPRADTKALTTRSPPFPVPLPLFLPKVWAEPMAAAAAPLMSGQGPECDSPRTRCRCPGGSGLHQPQDKVSVALGETLTLKCNTSAMLEPSPVRWLKGWGNENKTIYDQRESFPRVMRAVGESNTDFTIHIRNITLEDMGTYYCVKFCKGDTGEEEVFQRGRGTEVSVQETALVPGMVAAAVVLCFLLLLGLFVALCLYRKKRQGGVGSLCPARIVAMGSFSSVPAQCYAGTPRTPSRAARRRTTSTMPTCSLCPRSHGAAGARAQPPPSMPASGQLPGELSQDLKPSRPQDETRRPSTSALCKLFGADDTRRTSHTYLCPPVWASTAPFLAHRSIICVIFSLFSIKPANSLVSSPAVLRARGLVPVPQGAGD
uniref:Ig-like domain-containing protein n=1 Tax=Ficedula albicollis TaxID=59894 RepID=A0A803WGV9_FICAL